MAFETEIFFWQTNIFVENDIVYVRSIYNDYINAFVVKYALKMPKNYSYKSVEIMLFYYFLFVNANALSRFVYMKACVKFWYMSVYKIVNCIII